MEYHSVADDCHAMIVRSLSSQPLTFMIQERTIIRDVTEIDRICHFA